MIYPQEVTLDNLVPSKKYYNIKENVIFEITNTPLLDSAKQLDKKKLEQNCVKITYKDIADNTTDMYLNLEYLIQDGDVWSADDKIHPYELTDSDTLANRLLNMQKDAIVNQLKRTTLQNAIDNTPSYFKGEGTKVKDGKLIIASVTPSLTITAEELEGLLKTKAEESAKAAANEVLKTINKKVEKITLTVK